MAILQTATRRVALPALLLLGAAGCQTTPFIDQAQPEAVQTATRRAQFEFGCPAATGEVLSRENVVSPLQNTFRFSPPQRAEYTDRRRRLWQAHDLSGRVQRWRRRLRRCRSAPSEGN